MQPQARCHPCFLGTPLTSLPHHDRAFPSTPFQASKRPRLPKQICVDELILLRNSAGEFLCSQCSRNHDRPRGHMTTMHLSAVARTVCSVHDDWCVLLCVNNCEQGSEEMSDGARRTVRITVKVRFESNSVPVRSACTTMEKTGNSNTSAGMLQPTVALQSLDRTIAF